MTEPNAPINGTIDLDWYKDYPIEIVESVSKAESYNNASEKIIINNYSFGLITNAYWFSKENVEKFGILCEKARLVSKLDPHSRFKSFAFPLVKDQKKQIITEETLEDWIYDSHFIYELLDSLIGNLEESKKIVFQRRKIWTWHIYKDVPLEYVPDQQVSLLARFEFAILAKDAQRVINI